MLDSVRLFCGNANRPLAEEIAGHIGKPLDAARVGRFSDGEISVRIDETVRGCEVFIIQPTCAPVNDNLMELLIMIDAMKRASAGRITAVLPYFGYARQDRKVSLHDPITAKLVADLIAVSGADRVLTMDLHARQIQGFFDIPVDNLPGAPVLAAHYRRMGLTGEDWVVVSPDHGSVGRARSLADRLGAPLAIVDKRRIAANIAEAMHVIGDVAGRRALLADDMIDTAGTLTQAAEALMRHGAREVFACATHPVFSGEALARIAASPIRELVVADTIPQRGEWPQNIRRVSVAPLLAEAILRLCEDRPLSVLFE